MSRTRTFIGIDLGKPIRDRIVALQGVLARSTTEVKWVESDNLHVTLLFLGEVDDRQIPSICKIAAECTQKQAEFQMSVESVGCFPTPRRPRILWAGVGEGAQCLCTLHDLLEMPLQELGYRREERRYTPHITMGRARSERSAEPLAAAIAKQANWKGGEIMVTELRILGSELTSRGPVYTLLGRAPLQAII